MKFLTNERDLSLSGDDIYCFYSSDNDFFINDLLFKGLSILDKYNILCIDLYYFNNVYKRFDIKEIPTLLLMNEGKEIKRISGIPSKNDIDSFQK